MALEKIHPSSMPFIVGQVAYFAMNTAPAGFLKCEGQNVLRSTYAALFAVIGTTYGAGDGSTTFTLPDLRGEFLRGHDNGRGIDSGRVFGELQTDALQNITGTFHNWAQNGQGVLATGAFAQGARAGLAGRLRGAHRMPPTSMHRALPGLRPRPVRATLRCWLVFLQEPNQ